MILCIGEVLADLIGEEENGVMKYARYAGGAPLNVSCGIKRLDGNVGFIGSVGDDIIGHFLEKFVNDMHFDYTDVYCDPKHNTTLAFVDIDKDGERHFAFNRFESADYQVDFKRLEMIKNSDIIHLGSLMLREELGIKLADEVVRLTKLNHKVLSFDVNFRSDIYKSKEEAIAIYQKYIKEADILKFSEDEVELFTGKKALEGLNDLIQPQQLVFLTLGSKGSYFRYRDLEGFVETKKIKPVDTTGAGDAFYACVLKMLDDYNLTDLDCDILKNILTHANMCGALACSKKGAISALPTTDELKEKLL